MRDLYKRLGISSNDSVGKIREALSRCRDESVRRDAERVLLDPQSREVYDRNYLLLQKIAILRHELSLGSTENWTPAMQAEFGVGKEGGAAVASVGWVRGFLLIPLILAGCALFVAGLVWVLTYEQRQYNNAVSEDSVEGYTRFIADHPNSKYAKEVSRLRENSAFEKAKQMESESEWEQFLETYPDSIHKHDAERELKYVRERYGDFAYVRRIDTPDAYKRFLKLVPNGSDSELARKRLIDLEVDDIFGGSFGELPELQPLGGSRASTFSSIEISNDTKYRLTVRYSGADSQKHSIEPNQKQVFRLPKGEYRVTATVHSGNVRPYAGNETIDYDRYGVSFYILSYPYSSPFPSGRQR